MPRLCSTSCHCTAPRDFRGPIGITLVGAGGFAQGMHLPNLRKLKQEFSIRGIVSRTGANAKAAGQQFGAAFVSTDFKEMRWTTVRLQ